MGRRERNGSMKNREGRIWKRNLKSDDSDEDYMLEEDETDDQSDELASLVNDASDEESLGNFVDDEEYVPKVVRPKSNKRSIGRRKNGIKRTKRKGTSDDEEDDEDFEEEEEDADCFEGGGGPSSDKFVEEEEEENVRKVVNPKSHKSKTPGQRRNGIRSFRIRRRMENDKEDDDEDYKEDSDAEADSFDAVSLDSFVDEEEEENVRKVARPESRKRSTGQRENGTTSSRKRKRIADDEDYDDEEQSNDSGADNIDGVDHRVCSAGSVGRVSDDDDDEEYDYKDDDDDDVDDDDDEFTPEELDFLVEEDEILSPKGKKDYVRSQKRITGAKRLKKPKKNKKQGGGRSSKFTSSRSRKSVKRALPERGRCKRRTAHGKKKSKPCSDSDFAISEPSDCDFTISEEEREQVREANEFCKRQSLKQDQQDIAVGQLKKFPRRKGKEKVEEEIKSDVEKQVCGICLTKEGKSTTRGTLDCCTHFYCFPCIMEWSKVESRCPLCKQRFYTISKPARTSTRVDLRNVVIHVPERDQVYQPSEEELRDYLDSYENVFCTECHQGGDDDLMLLCDLCNSPSHTYCVGLGREVPDGNWYCEGCRPSVLGSTTSQAQDLTPPQRSNNNPSIGPTFENMAEIDLNITIPETPMTPVNELFMSPRQIPTSGGNPQTPSLVSGAGVSTLFGRRRVHRLQYLMSSNRRVDRVAQSLPLESPTVHAGTSYNADYIDRFHRNPFSLAQNRETFRERPNSLLRGQPQAFQAPSAADSPYNYMQSARIGNFENGSEFLQPCTSRLNMGSETGMSSMLNQTVVRQQLQTLVTSHLKTLCRDFHMELGEEAFQQIILGSTHTVLAACGLEHARTEVREVQHPGCVHIEALNDSYTSLIKGCCQGCFDSFVRDVVETIVMEVKAKSPEQLSFRKY